MLSVTRVPNANVRADVHDCSSSGVTITLVVLVYVYMQPIVLLLLVEMRYLRSVLCLLSHVTKQLFSEIQM